MIDLNKMEADHDRYKKALTQIRCAYVSSTIAHQTAEAALNPPPPEPVTLKELCATLKKINRAKGGELHSIRFFSDESGHLYKEGDKFYAAFYSLREALDLLNTDINEN